MLRYLRVTAVWLGNGLLTFNVPAKQNPVPQIWSSSRAAVSAGDSVYRGGIPAARSDGLPRGPAPAHAALLAEGEESSAQIHRCRFLLG